MNTPQILDVLGPKFLPKPLRTPLLRPLVPLLAASLFALSACAPSAPDGQETPPTVSDSTEMSFHPYLEQVEIPVTGPGTLVAEVTATGQKVTHVLLEYPEELLGITDLRSVFSVEVEGIPNQDSAASRTILEAYSSSRPKVGSPSTGSFVVLKLDARDEASDVWDIETTNEQEVTVHEGTPEEFTQAQIKQAKKSPVPREDVTYTITQFGHLTTLDGDDIPPSEQIIGLDSEKIFDPAISEFKEHTFSGDSTDAEPLRYRLRETQEVDAPLVIFLHGSGQYGDDNLAPLLSSRGAVGPLDYEDAYVLVPQYEAVFDSAEDFQAGEQVGGIHWQSNHRQQQVLAVISDIIASHPNIDKNRIYIHGLSRGAEGALNIAAKEPNKFAGAMIISGRELNARELVTGYVQDTDYSNLAGLPIWFFHSSEDPVAPIEGTLKNFAALSRLDASDIKYTEFEFGGSPNSGWLNESPHNSWDAVYNSPSAWMWLLSQKK